MEYTDAQKKAIEHGDGPFMVLAAPGSGKTMVITHHARYMIENLGINPANILVITFTKAAALEMRERFDKLMDGRHDQITFGTFHAVFFSILRQHFHYTMNSIMRDDYKRKLVESLCLKEDLEITDEQDYIEAIISEISYVKGELIDIDTYYSTSVAEDSFRRIYKGYEDRRIKAGLIDFDDMQKDCYNLLKSDNSVLERWRSRYKYILIDEFQDINKVQYDIVKLLAAPLNNIFIVGDDDQSIYHFRGARPEIMLNFTKDYENADSTLLGVNYRSSSEIIDAAKKVIVNNKKRYDKEIESFNGPFEPIHIVKVKDKQAEYKSLIELIRQYNVNHMLYSDMAILFRTNSQATYLTEKLMQYNVPFSMKEKPFNVFEHFTARDIIAYIRCSLGNIRRQDFLRIMNKPLRYISRDLLDSEYVDLEEMKTKLADKEWMVERVDELIDDLDRIRAMSPFMAVSYIRKRIGYDKYVSEVSKERRIELSELMEILDTLLESAREYKTFEEWFNHIEEYTKELNESHAKKANGSAAIKKDAVALMTMHGSKGLEFESVFIIDAVETVTPHKKATKDIELEEERRMFYVAMTRAKKHLYIYVPEEIYGKSVEQSRYIGEINLDRREISAGVRVRHKKFGEGVITYQDEKRISVLFDDGETHTFNIDYAIGNGYMEIID